MVHSAGLTTITLVEPTQAMNIVHRCIIINHQTGRRITKNSQTQGFPQHFTTQACRLNYDVQKKQKLGNPGLPHHRGKVLFLSRPMRLRFMVVEHGTASKWWELLGSVGTHWLLRFAFCSLVHHTTKRPLIKNHNQWRHKPLVHQQFRHK